MVGRHCFWMMHGNNSLSFFPTTSFQIFKFKSAIPFGNGLENFGIHSPRTLFAEDGKIKPSGKPWNLTKRSTTSTRLFANAGSQSVIAQISSGGDITTQGISHSRRPYTYNRSTFSYRKKKYGGNNGKPIYGLM